MNSTRFQCWLLSVPITTVVVGYMVALAMVTHHDISSIYAIIGLIGFFVLVGVSLEEKNCIKNIKISYK